MIVFVNGKFVKEEDAVISVFDRGFLYGDGLFETLLVRNGRPFRWDQHLERLRHGAALLKIELPFPPEDISRYVTQLIEGNEMPDAILRLAVTRGRGPRGYSPKGAQNPSLVMSLHSLPEKSETVPEWRLITSAIVVAGDNPLLSIKTSNKLHNILARGEAEDRGADEALILNASGEIAEASSSNVFWIENGKVMTTPLAAGALPGITRAVVFELCPKLGFECGERSIVPQELFQMEGVFLTLSTQGIVEVTTFDNHTLSRSPLVQKLAAAYRNELERVPQSAG